MLGELKVAADKVNPTKYLVEWEGAAFGLTCLTQPATEGAFGAAVVTSPKKDETQNIIDTHQAHIVISPLVPVDAVGPSIVQAMQLMRLAYALRASENPLGFFWDGSEVLLGNDDFNKAFNSLGEAVKRQAAKDPSAGSYLPISFWVGQPFFTENNPESPSLLSLGLRRFLGYEIQLPNLGDLGLMSETLERVVAYLFFQGGVVKDGDRLNSGNKEYAAEFKEQEKNLPNRMLLVPRGRDQS